MENDQPKKISLDQASIINLKAELLRKQEEFRLKKLSQFGGTSDEYETNKTQSTWGKKKPIKVDDKAQTSEQASKDNEEEEDTDIKMLEKSKKMLEAKAKYYEEVIVGKKSTEEGDEELFLVDFDRKIEESTKQENLEPKLKLKREVDESAYNEELRQKWEKEARENLEKDDIHYADLRFDEIRNMGVGNYRFATNEETRKAQMEFFKNIQTESKMNRILNEIYKLKREKLLVERISKVKQRKLLKFGYTLEQINSIVNFQSDIEEIEQEISNLENVIKNPELIERKEDEGEDDEVDIGQERDRNTEFKRRKAKTREWDKPKLKEKVWKNQIEKLRTERNQEFAPPQSYNTKGKKSRAQ